MATCRGLATDLVRRFRERGRTVLLCTHHMHEVEALCDRVIVLQRGELVFEGTLPQLREHAGQTALDQALLHVLGEEVQHAA